jgi:NitT/TauT family transport system substrate-binding protein
MRKLLKTVVAAAALLAAGPALAQTPVKIGIGFGVGFLPMFIADEMKLVEKHAKAAGVDVTANYQRFSGSAAMQDAILSGAVDMGVYGVPALLIAWDKAKNTPQQIFGISGVNASPLTLVTNKPGVKKLADLTPSDKIAMPAIVSPQMYVLQLAAEKDFGAANYDKLRPQVVALPHPEAVNAILSGGTEVKAYFSSPPFTQIALAKDGVSRITSSNEIFGGKSSFLVLGATKRWIDGNAKMQNVMVSAIKEASDLIRKDPKRAAEIYLKVEPSKMLDVAAVEKLLKETPDEFGPEVYGVKTFADFMGRIGGLKTIPASFKDVFPTIANTQSN